jgi:hypothetical protein
MGMWTACGGGIYDARIGNTGVMNAAATVRVLLEVCYVTA